MDIHDELSDLAPAKALIELLASEQRQRREQTLFGGECAFAQARVVLGSQTGTHELDQTDSGGRQNHDRDQHFEQHDAAIISQAALPSEHAR